MKAFSNDFQFQIYRELRKLRFSKQKKVHKAASVYCAAAIEYVLAEVLELSGSCCVTNKRKRILPRHIMLVVRQDAELQQVSEDQCVRLIED